MGIATAVSFEQLKKLPLVAKYEEAFRKATGIALKLVPPGTPAGRLSLEEHENAFCALVASSHPAVGEACWKVEAEVQRQTAQALTPQTTCCQAGLHLLATPVVVEGCHVATWIGGQVFHRKPSADDFQRVARHLAELGVTQGLAEIEAAFFGGRVVAEEQFRASLQLLHLFAQHLGESAGRLWMLAHSDEPVAVGRARKFIEAHLPEPITLRRVAAAAQLSPYHFCRVFRQTTGVTVTAYVARLRVERAKGLLADLSKRISEVSYTAGFGSIAQFNSMFRKYAGMSPTRYRETQKTHFGMDRQGGGPEVAGET